MRIALPRGAVSEHERLTSRRAPTTPTAWRRARCRKATHCKVAPRSETRPGDADSASAMRKPASRRGSSGRALNGVRRVGRLCKLKFTCRGGAPCSQEIILQSLTQVMEGRPPIHMSWCEDNALPLIVGCALWKRWHRARAACAGQERLPCEPARARTKHVATSVSQSACARRSDSSA